MATEAPAYGGIAVPSSGRRPPLPPVGDYLRAVWELGLRSARAALPALAFVYFYHLGAGLYMAFSAEGGSLRDPEVILRALMLMIAFLPLLLLVYTPLLPLQDSILQGTPRSFSSSVRAVLGRIVPLVALLLVQGLIIVGPPLLLLGGVGLFVRSLPSLPGSPSEVVRAAGLLALIPCMVYVLVMGLLLAFAQPVVVLDSRGPLGSIRTSFGLIASHFGGVLGRLLVFCVVLLFAVFLASLPITFLQVGTALSGYVHPAIKVANVIWEAALSAATFPFSVAAVLILYRSLRPAGAGIAIDGTTAASPAVDATRRATSPFQFE